MSICPNKAVAFQHRLATATATWQRATIGSLLENAYGFFLINSVSKVTSCG